MQTLAPTSVVLGNLSGVVGYLDESPDAPDGAWCAQRNSAGIAWTAPTTNTNGDSFDSSTNDRTLAGYRIYYGTTESEVEAKTSSYASASASPYTIRGLTIGTWYFLVVAVDGDGDMSSNVDSSSKVIS